MAAPSHTPWPHGAQAPAKCARLPRAHNSCWGTWGTTSWHVHPKRVWLYVWGTGENWLCQGAHKPPTRQCTIKALAQAAEPPGLANALRPLRCANLAPVGGMHCRCCSTCASQPYAHTNTTPAHLAAGLARAGHVPATMVVWGCGQSMGGVGGWAMPQGDTCCHFGPKCPPTLCPCLRKVWAGKLLANWVPPHVLAVPVIYPWAGKSLAMFWPLRNNSPQHAPHGGVGVRPKYGRYGRVGSARG